MKICFISSQSVTNRGGASLSMFNIAEELTKRGHKVVIVLNVLDNTEMINNDNIEIIPFQYYSMRININEETFLTKLSFAFKNIKNNKKVLELAEILRAKYIDIIHINGVDSSFAAKVANNLDIPYVWHIRQLLKEDFNQRLYREKNIMSYMKKADAIIAISYYVKERFNNKINRNIKVIYNGVPINEYYNSEKDIFKNDEVKLILAGRINEGKGQLESIKAVKILRDKGYKLKLFLVGLEYKEYTKKINDYIEVNNLFDIVEIKSHVNDLYSIRNQQDIGLTCSRCEAFGRVTVENQLAGLLAIGSNSGGTKELINHMETGLLYEPGDYHDLANKIEYAIENKFTMKKIAQNGRQSSKEYFTIKRVVDEVEDVYNNILNDL